jgi:5-methyltetrahydrofolate--homocysteine methyltransferase
MGKNIVTVLMKSAGFDVIDIGVDKTVEEIINAAKDNEVSVIGLSALLTTTMPQMQEFIEHLQESGIRDQYKVIIGGAPVTQDFCDQLGADGYGADATRAVEITKKLIS